MFSQSFLSGFLLGFSQSFLSLSVPLRVFFQSFLLGIFLVFSLRSHSFLSGFFLIVFCQRFFLRVLSRGFPIVLFKFFSRVFWSSLRVCFQLGFFLEFSFRVPLVFFLGFFLSQFAFSEFSLMIFSLRFHPDIPQGFPPGFPFWVPSQSLFFRFFISGLSLRDFTLSYY